VRRQHEPPCTNVIIGNDYPCSGQTSGVDRWNMFEGQCTSFAAWRLESVHHVKGFTNWYRGAHWGMPTAGTTRPGPPASPSPAGPVANPEHYGVRTTTVGGSHGQFDAFIRF
jgi:hypothetical protein